MEKLQMSNSIECQMKTYIRISYWFLRSWETELSYSPHDSLSSEAVTLVKKGDMASKRNRFTQKSK